MWTREDFINNVGREPELDDLERCNCPHAGETGHKACGVCKHNKPYFECHDCFVNLFAPVVDTSAIAGFAFNGKNQTQNIL
jgi:hypothetical protein